MRAVYLKEKGIFIEKDIPKPQPGPGQVLVKVKSVGVCGSDVHYWEHCRIGKFVVEKPLILGHEVSGEIAEIGRDVEGFCIGDKVVIEPGTPCGRCGYCKTGRYNLCKEIKFFATPPFDGAFCEYIAHNSDLIFKIPEGIDMDTATLVEPLSVGTFAAQRAGIGLLDRIIIYGAGVIGICCMLIAKEWGAADITMVDIREERLKLALEMGADKTIRIPVEEAPGETYDLAFECTGVAASLKDACRTVKPGGKIHVLGLGANSLQEIPIVDVVVGEQTITTSFRYANAFAVTLDIIKKQKEKLSKFITHKFALNDIQKAFETAKNDKDAMKVIVNL